MRTTAGGFIGALALLSPTALAGGRFVPLGNPRSDTYHARDVSTDPQGLPFVMGQSQHPDGTSQAALFTIHADGSVSPQFLSVPGGLPPRQSAWGAASGGAVVVGNAQEVSFPNQRGQAVVWSPPSAPATPLPCLQTTKDPNDGNCECSDTFKCDACDDSRGTIILAVGISFNDNFSVQLPTLWRSDNGWAPQQLDLLQGGLPIGAANAGNARDDGTITIVGEAVSTRSEPVIWDGATGQVRKILPRGPTRAAIALAVSRDDRYVAGWGLDANFNAVGMIWEDPDADGSYTLNIPQLPAMVLDSFFNAVEIVGSPARGEQVVAVGCGFDGSTNDLVALYYDGAGGLRRLSEVLVNENGIDIQGHILTDTTGLRRRPDAIHLAGNGVNAAGGDEGWYAEIALGASPCPGDLDGDGVVSIADLAILLSNFGVLSGATPDDGDFDGDGDVDLADLAQMLGVFGSACP